jgi:hypothetical protein
MNRPILPTFRQPSSGAAAAFLLAALLAPDASQGQGTFVPFSWPRVYDQECAPNGPWAWPTLSGMYIYDSDFYGRPTIGQSFIPTLSQVGFLQLGLDWDREGTFAVNLREQSITGPIVASLEAVVPSSGHQYNYGEFDFASPVTVVPGRTYVFELAYHGPPPTNSNYVSWCLVSCVNSEHNDLYTGGIAIWSGFDRPNADLWFREGIIVPEPSGVVLLLLGGGVLWAARRWWPRQRRPFP